MKERRLIAYYGAGRGKTSAALGYAMSEACKGDSVIVIQFLKQKDTSYNVFYKRLEPEIRFFRFQKSEKYYCDLSASEQNDECVNMKNGLNYARKVLTTGECNILVLDEILGLLDLGVINVDEILALLKARSENTEVILTGQHLDEALIPCLDQIYEICVRKYAS